MRRSCFGAGILLASSLIAGCDGGDASTVTPEQSQAAIDATKKWSEGHSRPVGGPQGAATPADIARKKQIPH